MLVVDGIDPVHEAGVLDAVIIHQGEALDVDFPGDGASFARHDVGLRARRQSQGQDRERSDQRHEELD